MPKYKGIFIYPAAAHGEKAVIRTLPLGGETLDEATKHVNAFLSGRFMQWDTKDEAQITVRTIYPTDSLHSVEIVEVTDILQANDPDGLLAADLRR